jgi:hypothetical protein
MTKLSIRTVNDCYDESEEAIDNLLAKLDLAKERTDMAATDLADA